MEQLRQSPSIKAQSGSQRFILTHHLRPSRTSSVRYLIRSDVAWAVSSVTESREPITGCESWTGDALGVSILLLVICTLACTARPVATATDQDTGSQIILAPGESSHIPGTDATIAFETVVEDSRCPTGQTCIREGDAAVRLRIEKPDAAPSTLTLHTGEPGAREADADGVNVRLVDVRPYPAGDTKPQQEEYRATLLVRQRPYR